MLTMTNASKALFTRLEKVTAAVPSKDLQEGRPQNPFSSLHWTLESTPGGYTISMMRSGVIVSQKILFRDELFLKNDKNETTAKVNDAAVDAIVRAMFEGIPALAA